MKKIILTGGGTAGHVTPNIALLPRLKELGYDISYIGSPFVSMTLPLSICFWADTSATFGLIITITPSVR